jgi:hypothetical protein
MGDLTLQNCTACEKRDFMYRKPFIKTLIAAFVLCGFTLGFPQQFATTEVAGGSGGGAFSDFQPPAGGRVVEVRVRSGDTIDSVQMAYILPDGRTVTGPRHGGPGGSSVIFRLAADEYIIGLSGRYGDTIDSLHIITNKRTSTQFGGNGGDGRFRIEVPAGNQAVGFTGRCGDVLDAIGLVYAPIPRRRDDYLPDQPQLGQFAQTQLAGGREGRPFSDQEVPPGARIVEVRVSAGDQVDSVQAVYALPDGRHVEGARHGGRGGNERIFRLDRDEYIIGLAGRCGDTIDLLRIVTNRRTSQPFGGRGGGRDYRIEIPTGSQTIGFAGRSGETLNAIGLAYTKTGNRR